MKVLQLGKFYPIKGGVEKVMYDLMSGLSERQIQCDMLCASVDKHYQEIKRNEFSTIYAMPSLTKKFGTMISPKLISRLKKIAPQYDLIHIHHPDPMVAYALYLSGYKGKVVVHWHSDILKQKQLLKIIMPLQRWMLKRADLIVGTTPVYVEESPHLSDYQEKVTYLPIGIKPLAYDEEKAQAIKKEYPGKKIVFSLGRLVEYKGFEYLVDAAQYLPDDYVVLIGGTGPLKNSLTEQISSQKLNNKVVLLGRVNDEDLPSYYGACDLFCLSSIMKTEAFAIVQIEAMSIGKPIVATRIPHSGVAWVNEDGVSGLDVEVKNPKALADGIRTIVEDPDLYAELSVGAKKRFYEVFREKKMIDGCLSIYNQVLGE